MSRRRIPGAAAALVVLAVGACGSSASTRDQPPTAPGVGVRAPGHASDQVIASDLVLQARDLTGNWTATPHTPNPAQDQNDAALAECLGIPNSSVAKTADAYSDDFANGPLQVSDHAAFYRDPTIVERDVGALRGPKAQPCLTDSIRSVVSPSLPAGASMQGISVAVVPGATPSRPNQIGTATAKITVAQGSQQASVILTVVELSGTRTEEDIDFTSFSGLPFPANQLDPIADTLSTRLGDR